MKQIIKGLIAVAILIGGLFFYIYYEEYPARTFCSNIPDGAAPSDVISAANQKGLPVFDVMKDRNMVVVLNHKSPFFRIACEVEFKDNQILSKSIVGAD